VVVPPLCSLKPGESIPGADLTAAQAEQVAPSTSTAAGPAPTLKEIPDPGLHAFDINFIMEQFDHFITNPFNGNVEDLPIPSDIKTQASKIIQDQCSDSIDISYINKQLKELKKQLADARSKFVITEIENSMLDSTKSLSLLHSRQLELHAQLETLVQNTCLDQQAKTTGYTDLVKGHVDQVVRKRRKIQKKAAIKNSSAPKPSSPISVPKENVPPKENTPPLVHDEPVANPSLVDSPRPTESVPEANIPRDLAPISEEGKIQ
jgi:hypothetical protein